MSSSEQPLLTALVLHAPLRRHSFSEADHGRLAGAECEFTVEALKERTFSIKC